MSKFSKGFTLAEVLITLLIIGVIASIVIPGLISNTNDTELRISWKKAYASIMQAQLMMVADSGSVPAALSSTSTVTTLNILTAFTKYLSTSVSQCSGRCWSPTIIYSTSQTCNFGNPGGTLGCNVYIDYGAVLNNGMNFLVNQQTTPGTLDTSNALWVDVNGLKGPNTQGKDLFRLKYNPVKQRFEAEGTGSTTFSCPTSNGIGQDCAAYYLMQ